MIRKFILYLLLASAINGNAQIRQTKSTGLKPIINSKIQLSPAVLASRKVFESSFTNPSFTQPINGLGVNYTLKAVSLSDESNSLNITSTPNNPPANTSPAMLCTSSREKVTANSTDFLSVSATGVEIYPGAVYKYDDFYKGNYQNNVLNSWARNPIELTSDAAQSVTVANPTPTSLNNAAVSFKTQIPLGTGNIDVGQYTYSNNLTALMVNATAGGAYAGFSGSANFNFSQSDSSVYITYDFRKIIYTLKAELPSNGFFTDPEKEKTPNLIWINTVSYGARILANVKINASQLKIGAGLQFQYGDPSKAGFKAAGDFVSQNKNLQCTINTYSVGIPNGYTLGASISTTLEDLYNKIMSALNAATPTSAKPVMYSLYNMACQRIAVESNTDYYTKTLCMPKDAVYSLVGKPKVVIKTGAGGFDDKLAGSIGKVSLQCCAGMRTTMYSDESNVKFDPNSTNEFSLNKKAGLMLQDFVNGVTLEINLNPTNILGVYDEWRIVSASLEFELADQNGTPFPKGKITLPIPNVGSGIILSKNKTSVVSTISFDARSMSFSASSANQR